MTDEKNVLPSSAKVRSTLQNLEEGEVKVDVSRWPIPINGKTAKMGFLYEYLTACRVTEVFGKYAPQTRHCFNLHIDGEPAVLFVVKTAKKNTKRGWLLRPALLPLSPKYEPLVKVVRDYINDCKNEHGENYYPFMLAPNPETSKRYAEAYMKTLFKEHRWFFVDYIRNAYAHPSLGYTIDPQTRIHKLLTEEEARSHGDKITFKKRADWVPVSIRIESRWKPVNTNELRKIRLRELEQVYELETKEINTYAGWRQQVAQVARHYIKKNELELDINEDPGLPRILAAMGKPYFRKLLVPIGRLLNPQETEFSGIEFI
jgi:hypothetical protein